MATPKNLKAPANERASDNIAFVEDLKRQWVAMIDALVDPMCIVSRDFKIAKANKAMAKLAGAGVKEVIGQPCFEVFANRKSPCDGCLLNETVTSRRSHSWSLAKVRGESEYEVSSQPILDANGDLDGVVQVYRDRTESIQLQRQLLQSEKLASIGLLAGGFAHEINNPLGGILIFAQMLKREMDPESPHFQDVEEILNATQRCKAIVENLLEFARQQPADRSESLGEIDVIEAVKSALRFAKVGHNGDGVDVHEDWKIAPVRIIGDHNKMIQVFLNLIQNAFHAMPDGGTLFLRSYAQGQGSDQKMVIEVEDTGVGIPLKHRDRIFDPFFTTKEPGEGTGLGLAICYGIIDDLGGTLSLESELNQGTVFRLSFKSAPKPAPRKV